MYNKALLHGEKLLILAATSNQIPLIIQAKAMGAYVITVDNRPDNPGHALADEVVMHDIRDADGIVALARRLNVQGVIAAATDVAVMAAASVGAELGLRAPSRAAAIALTSKAGFRELQERLGLPHPEWSSELAARATPCIVKPCRGSGSRGIRVIDDLEQLEPAWKDACAASADGKAIVEDLMPGTQHTFEGVLVDGRAVAYFATDRLTADPPLVATRGHRLPSRLSPETQAAALAQIEAVFAAVGQLDGAFDADVVATPDGPVIIEMSPRVGGNALMRLTEASTRTDHLSWVILSAMGMAPPVSEWAITHAGCDVLGDENGGTLDYDPLALADLRHEKWCHHVEIEAAPGDKVPPFTDGRCRFGEAVVTGSDRAEVEKRLIEVRSRLALTIR